MDNLSRGASPQIRPLREKRCFDVREHSRARCSQTFICLWCQPGSREEAKRIAWISSNFPTTRQSTLTRSS